MKSFIIDNIKQEDEYMVDFAALENKIKEQEQSEQEQLKEKVEQLRKFHKRGYTLVYKYSALVKKECGHWEHLQINHKDWLKNEDKGRCTRCICNISLIK